MTKPTTIRLDVKLRKRLEQLAEALDRSAHGLMLEGIEAFVQNAEDDLEWERELDRRERAAAKTGKTIAHADMKRWFAAARRGERREVPAARKRARKA
jgi:predicted transcriptional regulator